MKNVNQTEERKIAVYLTPLDWEAVLDILGQSICEAPLNAKVIWVVGRNRVRYIQSVISGRLPAKFKKATQPGE